MASKPTVVAVSGVNRGLKVGVIKHDGHRFDPDVPGTDSWRHRRAGAYGTAIYDGETTKVIWRQTPDLPGLLELFSQADLILLEGGKHSTWPKLELVRAGNSNQSVCDPATLLALVTDTDLCLPGIPTLSLNDPAGVVDFLMKYLERGRST